MAANSKRKIFEEEFAQFFESPTREGLRDLLRYNHGEFPYVDFKAKLQPFPKVARHLLGQANFGGGCLIVGVAEKDDGTLESVGVEKLEDKAVILNGIKKFLPAVLLENVEIVDFAYQDSDYKDLVGKKFQFIRIIGDSKHLPFVSQEGQGESIRRNAIYVRRGTATEEANYEELQSVINRRLETGYSSRTEIDVRTHIEQLKMLYGQVDSFQRRLKSTYGFLSGSSAMDLLGLHEKVANPFYPEENFDEFIARMIEKKKKRVEILLDVLEL